MLQQDELLFVVDKNNTPQEPLSRSMVHEKHLWHRTAHIWIINKKKHILCHQRSLLKDISPGNWDPYFGGHLGPDVSFEIGALTELEEETGIPAKEEDLTFYKVYKNEGLHEFQGIFAYVWEGNAQMLSFETDEVAQVTWMPIKKVKEFITQQTPGWSKIAYADEVLDWLYLVNRMGL